MCMLYVLLFSVMYNRLFLKKELMLYASPLYSKKVPDDDIKKLKVYVLCLIILETYLLT